MLIVWLLVIVLYLIFYDKKCNFSHRIFSKTTRRPDQTLPLASNEPLIPSYLISSIMQYNVDVNETLPPKYEEFISSRQNLENVFRDNTNTV